MNNDLISRSALLEALRKESILHRQAFHVDTKALIQHEEEFSACMRVVCSAPAVDAEAVRHGRWIEVVTYDQDGDCLEVEYKCSECGRIEGLDDEPYCNCGAKMMENGDV